MAPRRKGDTRLYKVGPFTDSRLRAKIAKKVYAFNINPIIKKFVSGLMNKGETYGLCHHYSHTAGSGIFARCPIPKGRQVLIYPATFFDPECHDGDRTYCFEVDLEIDGKKVPVIMDGKQAVEAMDKLKEKTDSEKKFDNINGSRNNHRCLKPNIGGEWKTLDGIPYVVYTTIENVKPGQELLSNYNAGEPDDDNYFRKVEDLLADGCPPELIENCNCANGYCPKGFGYDLRSMHPDMY